MVAAVRSQSALKITVNASIKAKGVASYANVKDAKTILKAIEGL